MFPRLLFTCDGPTDRGRIPNRGEFRAPNLERIVTPNLQPNNKRNASASPIRVSPRNRSPSKAIDETKRYEEDIAAGEINNPEKDRRPLSQRDSNERIAFPVNENKKKQIRSVNDQENENTQGDEDVMDWADQSSNSNNNGKKS